MRKIFFLSDHHFNHENVIRFKGNDGKLIRPGFKNIQEMNECLLDLHNQVVKPKDKFYFGGDVGRNFADIVKKMNGHKRLILGNHDDKMKPEEKACFEKILMWRTFTDQSRKVPFVLSHAPMHPDSFLFRAYTRNQETFGLFGEKKRICRNVHGHLHEKTVNKWFGLVRDNRYFNISAEQLFYVPIEIEELMERMSK